jgi:hypothetical protein
MRLGPGGTPGPFLFCHRQRSQHTDYVSLFGNGVIFGCQLTASVGNLRCSSKPRLRAILQRAPDSISHLWQTFWRNLKSGQRLLTRTLDGSRWLFGLRWCTRPLFSCAARLNSRTPRAGANSPLYWSDGRSTASGAVANHLAAAWSRAIPPSSPRGRPADRLVLQPSRQVQAPPGAF